MLQGYCTSSKSCKTFAVVLASFGSALASATDAAALSDLAAYMQPLCGLPACLAADGAHGPVSSWFWNGWTPDLAGVPDFLTNLEDAVVIGLQRVSSCLNCFSLHFLDCTGLQHHSVPK